MKKEELTPDSLTVIVQKTNELLSLCVQVKKDNETLRRENVVLKQERDKLRKKTRVVHERVKKMINEIKHLERQT